MQITEEMKKKIEVFRLGVLSHVQILRASGSYYERVKYGLPEEGFRELELKSIQSVVVGMMDALTFQMFMKECDRQHGRWFEEKPISERWVEFREEAIESLAPKEVKKDGEANAQDSEEKSAE